MISTQTLTEYLDAENVAENINDTLSYYAKIKKKSIAASGAWTNVYTVHIYFNGENMIFTTKQNKILSENTMDLISYGVGLWQNNNKKYIQK